MSVFADPQLPRRPEFPYLINSSPLGRPLSNSLTTRLSLPDLVQAWQQWPLDVREPRMSPGRLALGSLPLFASGLLGPGSQHPERAVEEEVGMLVSGQFSLQQLREQQMAYSGMQAV